MLPVDISWQRSPDLKRRAKHGVDVLCVLLVVGCRAHCWWQLMAVAMLLVECVAVVVKQGWQVVVVKVEVILFLSSKRKANLGTLRLECPLLLPMVVRTFLVLPNVLLRVHTSMFGCLEKKLSNFVYITPSRPSHCTGKGGQAQSLKSAEASKRQMALKHQSLQSATCKEAPKWFGVPALDLVDVQIPCGAVACRSVKASQSVKACQSAKASQSVKACQSAKASQTATAGTSKHKFWYTPCLLCMSRAHHVSRNLIWIGAAKLLSPVAWPTCVWLWPRVVLQEYQHDKHGMLSFWFWL